MTLTIILTSCCKDDIVTSYRLTDSERNLIPFIDFNRIPYTNQDGINFTGLAQPKEYKIDSERLGAESCNIRETESMYTFIGFENKDFVFQLTVSKYSDDLVEFKINKSILDSINSQEYFSLQCNGASIYKEDTSKTNISLHGFDFEDVLIFKDCENVSEINQIIYSEDKGIEFIEYDNENYLKLND